MPESLLPCLVLAFAILTSAILRATADHRLPSSDAILSALARQTILGCGALALKANIVQEAPSAGDLILAGLVLIGLEFAPLLLARPSSQDD